MGEIKTLADENAKDLFDTLRKNVVGICQLLEKQQELLSSMEEIRNDMTPAALSSISIGRAILASISNCVDMLFQPTDDGRFALFVTALTQSIEYRGF